MVARCFVPLKIHYSFPSEQAGGISICDDLNDQC